jgi:hypothetical protein
MRRTLLYQFDKSQTDNFGFSLPAHPEKGKMIIDEYYMFFRGLKSGRERAISSLLLWYRINPLDQNILIPP